MEHYNILIATPGHSLEAEYVKSLTLTLAAISKKGLTYKWLNEKGSLVHEVREATLTGDYNLNLSEKGPLHDKVTYDCIFWIDSDISWTVDQFFRLYESKYQVTSGAYLLPHGATTVSDIKTGVPYSKAQVLAMSTPIRVSGVGLGFVCVKAGVFERLPRPWFYMMSRSMSETLIINVGEDSSWCAKIYQNGMEVWFDPKVLVGHVKSRILTWR